MSGVAPEGRRQRFTIATPTAPAPKRSNHSSEEQRPPADKPGLLVAATDAYAVLDEAFLVAQKQLKDYRRVSHGDVKYKSAPGAQTSEL